MKLSVIAAVLVFSTALSIEAVGSDLPVNGGASHLATGTAVQPTTSSFDREYRRYRFMRAMGASLLGSGIGIATVGAGLVEASALGPVGWAGFVTVGVGLVHFIASVFLLGFSRTMDTMQMISARGRDQYRLSIRPSPTP